MPLRVCCQALLISKNHSPGGPNASRYSNPKVDALYEKALAESNAARDEVDQKLKEAEDNNEYYRGLLKK